MNEEGKAKMILSVLFCPEFAIDCINENESVDEDAFRRMVEQDLPNCISDESFDIKLIRRFCLKETYGKLCKYIKDAVESRKESLCGNCKAELVEPRSCTKCLVRYHDICFNSTDGNICFSCEKFLKKRKEEMEKAIEEEQREKKELERWFCHWRLLLRKMAHDGSLMDIVQESSDPDNNKLLAICKYEGKKYAHALEELFNTFPKFEKEYKLYANDETEPKEKILHFVHHGYKESFDIGKTTCARLEHIVMRLVNAYKS
ncbi:uncharacterized protein LOC130630459 [Hydractinia symbiolongicarpus]|uniref:uncharacterized protein LOC130630459 n=1 Tax=Hydractinia symbiolongicarpus TaxID=13093 RepID=UPI00254E7C02|nr:uncharacterized protein LOC130630459 [Hydractinia symbiolongicarpus]